MSGHKTQEWVDKLELQNALRFAKPGDYLITRTGSWILNPEREWHWSGTVTTKAVHVEQFVEAFAGQDWSIS